MNYMRLVITKTNCPKLTQMQLEENTTSMTDMLVGIGKQKALSFKLQTFLKHISLLFSLFLKLVRQQSSFPILILKNSLRLKNYSLLSVSSMSMSSFMRVSLMSMKSIGSCIRYLSVKIKLFLSAVRIKSIIFVKFGCFAKKMVSNDYEQVMLDGRKTYTDLFLAMITSSAQENLIISSSFSTLYTPRIEPFCCVMNPNRPSSDLKKIRSLNLKYKSEIEPMEKLGSILSCCEVIKERQEIAIRLRTMHLNML